MELRITDVIFDKFPDTILGVVVAHGVNNRGENRDVIAILHKEEARLAQELSGLLIKEHPHISPWRDAYRAFGANPKDYPSSIENLVKRVQKGQTLRHINTLVDIYNSVSLKYIVPVGGEDLDKIDGDILLTIAGTNEASVQLLGERDERAPYENEVIYKDNVGAICRRWNWKEADRTKLTEETQNLVMVIEGLPPVGRSIIEKAINDLAEMVRHYCGGTVTTAILDRSIRSVTLM